MVLLRVSDKMSTFNEHQFEKKLLSLKDSQDSIQNLSAWCLQHRQQNKKIVAIWLKVLRKVKPDQRLTLFYLANDVIQYSKRKGYEFVQTFAPALQKATTLVRDNKVKQSILRIFKIWDERGIYDETFISDLTGLLTTSTKGQASEPSQPLPDFQPRILIEKIKSCKECEDETDMLLKKLNDSHLSLSDADALRASLKDRRQGDDVVSEVDEGVAKMEAYVRALEQELKERAVLIELLEQGNQFYDVQKGEAKVVANAYKNFGSRVKNLKRRLDELIPSLKDCSPVPSPDVNAPSPSPDSDIELPEESDPIPGLLNQTSSSSFDAVVAEHQSIIKIKQDLPLDSRLSSFMGNSLSFDFKKSIFNETSTDTPRSPSPTPMLESGDNDLSAGEALLSSSTNEGKPIEVISSRSKSQENFNISEFLKSLSQGLTEPFLQSDSSSSVIPGLGVSSQGAGATSTPAKGVGLTAPLFSSPPGVFELPGGQLNYQKTPANQNPSVNPDPLPPPPPLPPSLFMLEEGGEWPNRDGAKSSGEWNTKLPPKFPTWGDPSPSNTWDSNKNSSDKVDWFADILSGKPLVESQTSKVSSMEETPESPPTYEKEGFSDPVEYDDTEPSHPPSSSDVDHRTLVPIAPNSRLREAKDIDHRNLISLTGSPAPNFRPINASGSPWIHSELKTSDQDYRNVASINLTSAIGTLSRGNDSDCDYRIPIPPPLTGKLQETPKRDESHDNIESVDMEMSDDEDNAESLGKDQNSKSDDKDNSVRNAEKRGTIGKPNVKPSSKPDSRTSQEGFYSESKPEKPDSFDSSFSSLPLQKIQTIGTDRGIFRPRTPVSQNFQSPVVRQTFDSHFPAMPPVPPGGPMFRMPPHDLAKPPPPLMPLSQPLLLQQKPPPPPPPPPLPGILSSQLQKAGMNDQSPSPVQPVSISRNAPSNLSVPSSFHSSDIKSPLSSKSTPIPDNSGMKWGKTETIDKDGSWGSVTGYGDQANGSFKNSQNEDFKKTSNENESFAHSSTSNDFRTGSTLRILSLTELNTKDPPPFPSSAAKDNNLKEISTENIPVIPNASLNLPDNNSVGQSVSTPKDKSASGINIISGISNIEIMNKEVVDGMDEPITDKSDVEQGSMNNSVEPLNTSDIHDFPREEISDAFFSPTLAFPPPGLGFSVPPPQRSRGRGFRGAGPIRFGIPHILPRFFRPPPIFAPLRQPLSPDVQFVGGRGPRTPFRPFRGSQGPFGGRW